VNEPGVNQRLLLDTNVLIWTLSSSNKISRRAERAMSRPLVSLTVSVVSVWEIVLKHHAGKLRLPVGLHPVVDQILYGSPWTILPVAPEHLPALAALPAIHTDPFDRLLIAQARHEGMAILTANEQFKKYDVRTIW
jgi:PIN domain nuclease of toxin-antitoxin system